MCSMNQKLRDIEKERDDLIAFMKESINPAILKAIETVTEATAEPTIEIYISTKGAGDAYEK